MISEASLKATYQVFSEGQYRGNCALVTTDRNAQPDWNTVSACAVLDAPKAKLTSPLLPVHWFGATGSISFCGHGALATAAHLFEIEPTRAELQLTFPAGTYKVKKIGDKLWLTQVSPKLPNMVMVETLQYQQLIKQTQAFLVEAIEVGNHNEYLILRLQDNVDLKQVTLCLSTLVETTKRALIITTAYSSNALEQPEDKFDYALRYFAPQYGNAEDAATGSANLILAKYWQERLKRNHYRVYQASPPGAIIYVECADNVNWIGGSVNKIVTEGNNPNPYPL